MEEIDTIIFMKNKQRLREYQKYYRQANKKVLKEYEKYYRQANKNKKS